MNNGMASDRLADYVKISNNIWVFLMKL
jgi:hypothetical protein